MKKILFVCTGNTCRSPMAEALLANKSQGKYEAKSAGIYAAGGSAASSQTELVLKELGIHIDHASSPLTEELLEWADLVLTMTESHKKMIGREYPQTLDKLFTLKEYTGGGGTAGKDVSDPFGGSAQVYRQTRKEIEAEVDRLIEKLEENEGES